jgi:transcriptional regulator with XRE-family HTH domain
MSNIITQRFIKCHDKLREDKEVKSSRQFAKSLDYLPQSLSEILKGRRDVTLELLRKSVEVYNINPFFLHHGKSPMFLNGNEVDESVRVLTVVSDDGGDERILHVPVPAQAGYPAEIGNPTFMSELPTYTLPDYKYKVGTHRSFDVAGDSMEPTLFEGDKVICSYQESNFWETSIKDNYVYVIITQSDVLVKRVYNKISESKSLVLISDNDYYQPFKVNLSDIQEIWYVRAKLSPFLPSPNNLNNILHSEVKELRSTILQQSKIIKNLSTTLDNFMKEKV